MEQKLEFIPREDDMKMKGAYVAGVKDVFEEGVLVSILKDDDNYIQEIFPFNLFKGKKPEVDDDLKYHVWQLQTGEYGGYFENLGYNPVPVPEKDREKLERIFEKWENEDNE